MPSGIYQGKNGEWAKPSFTKNCAECGKKFKCYSSLQRVKHCSKECAYASRKRRSEEIRKCEHCGKEFNKARYKPQIYCSPACRNTATNIKRRGSEWKIREKDGYVIRSNGFGKTEMQHRHVMEGVLGRKLHSFETIHHKNGQRSDNRPENLEVWVEMSRKGQRIHDMIEWATDLLNSQGFTVIAPTDQHSPNSSLVSNGAGQTPVET